MQVTKSRASQLKQLLHGGSISQTQRREILRVGATSVAMDSARMSRTKAASAATQRPGLLLTRASSRYQPIRWHGSRHDGYERGPTRAGTRAGFKTPIPRAMGAVSGLRTRLATASQAVW